MNKMNFNITQGMTLLLLKQLSLTPNFALPVIIFLTNQKNAFGDD